MNEWKSEVREVVTCCPRCQWARVLSVMAGWCGGEASFSPDNCLHPVTCQSLTPIFPTHTHPHSLLKQEREETKPYHLNEPTLHFRIFNIFYGFASLFSLLFLCHFLEKMLAGCCYFLFWLTQLQRIEACCCSAKNERSRHFWFWETGIWERAIFLAPAINKARRANTPGHHGGDKHWPRWSRHKMDFHCLIYV